MPEADSVLDLAAVRREFRGMGFANNFGNARGAASARLVHFDLEPAKRGGLLDLPFPNAERAGEFTHGHRTGTPDENALDTVETFAAKGEGAH